MATAAGRLVPRPAGAAVAPQPPRQTLAAARRH